MTEILKLIHGVAWFGGSWANALEKVPSELETTFGLLTCQNGAVH
jgi:hypothetical protein